MSEYLIAELYLVARDASLMRRIPRRKHEASVIIAVHDDAASAPLRVVASRLTYILG